MVHKGAKHLLLLSRSGEKDSASSTFLNDIREANVEVDCPACDISSSEELAEVLRPYGVTKPPIAGCVQASMVLKVSSPDQTIKRLLTGNSTDWYRTPSSKTCPCPISTNPSPPNFTEPQIYKPNSPPPYPSSSSSPPSQVSSVAEVKPTTHPETPSRTPSHRTPDAPTNASCPSTWA